VNGSDGKFEKARIEALEGALKGQPIECTFNPKEFTIDKRNTWSRPPNKGKEVPPLEFGGGNASSLKMELFFDKGGIIGGWIYGGGIFIAFYLIVHDYKKFPPGMILFLLIGLPSLLLFIKEPYHHFKHKREQSDKGFNLFTIFTFLMQWIVELLEIFSGYLSNTLSFMRVAGLGIAHACLMIAFFTLAEMTSGIMSVLILILGNILVIGLEGLCAGIQALRLNYYEFFTKFFQGTGVLYTPVSLNSSHK